MACLLATTSRPRHKCDAIAGEPGICPRLSLEETPFEGEADLGPRPVSLCLSLLICLNRRIAAEISLHPKGGLHVDPPLRPERSDSMANGRPRRQKNPARERLEHSGNFIRQPRKIKMHFAKLRHFSSKACGPAKLAKTACAQPCPIHCQGRAARQSHASQSYQVAGSARQSEWLLASESATAGWASERGLLGWQWGSKETSGRKQRYTQTLKQPNSNATSPQRINSTIRTSHTHTHTTCTQQNSARNTPNKLSNARHRARQP